MIRVGFVLEGSGWQGGVNYYRNLFSALDMLTVREIYPVMFVGTRVSEDIAKNFHHAEIVRTRILDSDSPSGLLRRVLRRISGQRDVLLSRILTHHKIDVLSHSGPLWPVGKIKTIGWVADFQHLYFPEFFSESECAQRNVIFNRIACDCDCVLVSSETAKRDLATFAPEADSKTRVLRFVPEVNLNATHISVHDLKEKYDFCTPYFFLPNQFWIHKNHKIVVEALAELKREGFCVTVLATGNKEDYRHPSHFSNLMALVGRLGLTESFKVLGVVPYSDLLSLMRHSLAVINPSLFEGWSSTVEEAKALGVATLLSDLPVHREQNPLHGVYFDPANAKELANKMLAIMVSAEQQAQRSEALTYSDSFISDRLDFAQAYQDIVVKLTAKVVPTTLPSKQKVF